mmetsp:Transcript_42078/g.95891  ORF Transcript_42078/g.95891 Transcript_42078/m.95891 type:complete len:372 (+) Transcript_42078:1007-2122(+)
MHMREFSVQHPPGGVLASLLCRCGNAGWEHPRARARDVFHRKPLLPDFQDGDQHHGRGRGGRVRLLELRECSAGARCRERALRGRRVPRPVCHVVERRGGKKAVPEVHGLHFQWIAARRAGWVAHHRGRHDHHTRDVHREVEQGGGGALRRGERAAGPLKHCHEPQHQHFVLGGGCARRQWLYGGYGMHLRPERGNGRKRRRDQLRERHGDALPHRLLLRHQHGLGARRRRLGLRRGISHDDKHPLHPQHCNVRGRGLLRRRRRRDLFRLHFQEQHGRHGRRRHLPGRQIRRGRAEQLHRHQLQGGVWRGIVAVRDRRSHPERGQPEHCAFEGRRPHIPGGGHYGDLGLGHATVLQHSHRRQRRRNGGPEW